MSDEITYDENDYEDYKSVQGFRRKNIFYKRLLLESVYTDWNDTHEIDSGGVDNFLIDLHSLGDYPDKHKKELICDRIFFLQIITLIDFINFVSITFVMAKMFCHYELIVHNIKYLEDNKDDLLSNYKPLNPKSFDWEKAELNNYKFIVSL